MNFRFHLVSLIAVFLALALGIGMGATVIDKATVESLKRRVAVVESAENTANQKLNAMTTQQARDASFGSLLSGYVTPTALRDVAITLVVVKGTEPEAINETRKALAGAGGRVQGVITLNPRLVDSGSTSALSTALATTTADPAQLRQLVVARFAQVLAGSAEGETLRPLLDAGFLEYDNSDGLKSASFGTFGGSRVLVMTNGTLTSMNDSLLTPLLKSLSVQPNRRVLVTETGRDQDGAKPAMRAVYLDTVRPDSDLRKAMSTVDNIETPTGRVAAVLALHALGTGRVGHFGVANSAESIVPKAAS